MPLYDIRNDKKPLSVPRVFVAEFKRLRAALGSSEFQAVVDRINELIDASGAEIATAGWLPGSDWRGTPFESIYTRAAGHNQALAGKLFGLCVWHAVAERPEDWSSGRYQKDGRDIGSRTYFRINR